MLLIACEGIQQHVCHCAHACDATIWHTHQGEDRKQVQLALNMYFGKLMCTTTITYLEISADTMHQHVVGPVTPRTSMCMLSDELDGGAISVYPDETEVRVRFSKMSPLSAWTPSWMMKLGINSPPSTITRMSNIWSHHNGPSVSDVFHGLLKLFCLIGVHVHCNVMSCQCKFKC